MSPGDGLVSLYQGLGVSVSRAWRLCKGFAFVGETFGVSGYRAWCLQVKGLVSLYQGFGVSR